MTTQNINNHPEKAGNKLFEPTTLKGLTLKNRIVMAPMTRSRATGAVPNDLMISYYTQRASAGLIITEGTAPSPNGLGYARIPGIFNEEQVGGWKKVTDAVHHKGGKIFIQFMHVGRIAHPDNMPEEAKIVAPSAIRAAGDMWTDTAGMQPFPTPQAMSLAGIAHALQEFTQAAKNAMVAGFDGVELHGANGYLLEQFLNPHVNVRTDHYGGNISNRTRFVLEVVSAIARAIGKEKVGIRLSPYNTFNDMPSYDATFDTYDYLSKKLNKLDILYVHLVESSAREKEEGVRLIAGIRENFQNGLIVNGGYTREKAEEVLAANGADLVSFGSSFIANPDLPERMLKAVPLSSPDTSTFYTPGEKGYTDYSFHHKSEKMLG